MKQTRRWALAPLLTERKVAVLAPVIREICRELLDQAMQISSL
jgi:cytochrome P450